MTPMRYKRNVKQASKHVDSSDICTYFLYGTCAFGSRCKKSHDSGITIEAIKYPSNYEDVQGYSESKNAESPFNHCDDDGDEYSINYLHDQNERTFGKVAAGVSVESDVSIESGVSVESGIAVETFENSNFSVSSFTGMENSNVSVCGFTGMEINSDLVLFIGDCSSCTNCHGLGALCKNEKCYNLAWNKYDSELLVFRSHLAHKDCDFAEDFLDDEDDEEFTSEMQEDFDIFLRLSGQYNLLTKSEHAIPFYPSNPK